MGIYDREYVRVGPRSPSWVGALRMFSFNTWLIIVNVAVFVLDMLLANAGVVFNVVVATRQVVDPATGQTITQGLTAPMGPLAAFFHFSSAKLFFGLEFWRLLGFQFLHANLTHLFFNMIGLYFFGGLVEGYLGSKRYAAFYLVCGIFGAVLYLILNLMGTVAAQMGLSLPLLLINDMHTPLIGASAGVFGVLMAAAFVAPNAQILIFFILPMRLATAAYLFVLLAFLNLLTLGANAGGDAAHL
ncbi:MAG: rhomboid family intramembrane serine protease, partial [Planctomycetota bacterium]|nr:rhomboid family intramembrane serine protease [Planctomycetota bacterium]